MTEKPKVYFSKIITPENLIEMYKKLNFKLEGNIGIKIHSGEKGNKNFLRPEFMKPIVDYLDGTIIETNTSGPEKATARTTLERHKKLLEEHGWSKIFKKVDILDSELPDEELEIPNGIRFKKNYIGNKTKNYDSFLVISHFKGHIMGGYGGALKQLSIGFSSRLGKTLMHSGGKNSDPEKFMQNICPDKDFKEFMADCAFSIMNKFKGCMKDIGILASLDPVAVDKACLDLIYNSNDPGKDELIKRIESKYGPHIIECSVKLGTGSSDYELINVD